MKKVLVICLALIMVMSMSLTAFAATNGFVSSPTSKPAPDVIEFTPADEDCTAHLAITPYGEKEELPNTLQTMMDKAYDEVRTSTDLSKLNADLAKLATDKNIKAENLAVSDLFDIHVTGCDYHDGHIDFDITLDAEMLSRFVALLHMKKDGTWELVKDAKVANNGEHLQFSVESFSPFAIVVDTDSPKTGASSMLWLYIVLMVVSASALVAIWVRAKKHKA